MSDEIANHKLFGIIRNNTILVTAVPVVAGSAYIFGYLTPLGRIGLQAISYTDIFSASLSSIFVCSTVLISYYLLRLFLKFMKRRRIRGREIPAGIILSFLNLFIIFLIIYMTGNLDSRSSLFYNSIIFTYFSIPLILTAWIDVIDKYILYVIFIIAAPFMIGHSEGRMEIKRPLFVDNLCIDKCFKVSIYSVLSEYVIAISCDGKIMVVPNDNIRLLLYTNRDISMLLSDSNRDDCEVSR